MLLESLKLVLFDFDGTISDSHEAAIDTYNSLSAKYGFRSVQQEDLNDLKNKTSREVLKNLGISLFKLPFVVREARIKFQKQIHQLQPFTGVPDSLLELKKLGFQLGILTSNSKENVSEFLKKNQLDLFDLVYSGASIFGKSKVIKTALKNGRLSAHEVIYVGDETRDIDAARGAGVRVVSVSWGFNTKEVLKKQNPDFLIDHPIELPQVLSALTTYAETRHMHPQ